MLLCCVFVANVAVQMFSLEIADGVGSSLEIVLQTFFRFSTLTFLPIIIGSAIIYLLVTK